jgi:uncharacterized protein YciI
MILLVLLAGLLTLPIPPLQSSPQPEMTTYQMVLLKKGPNAPPADADTQKKMQDDHLANLADLNRKRINLLYGPVLSGGDLVGIAVFAVPNADEAKRTFAADPFVKAGVMVADVRPWMGPKDWFSVPPSYDVTNPASLEPLVLGFLVRRPAAPAIDPATSEQIQKGHLAYMEGLHKQGKLLVAGPFLDDTPSRGIVIYRVKDVAEATALAAEDPAVKAGRLMLEAHPWMTFKGILK